MKAFQKVFGGVFGCAAALAALFFGGVGIYALITHQDYSAVLQLVGDWINGLGK